MTGLCKLTARWARAAHLAPDPEDVEEYELLFTDGIVGLALRLAEPQAYVTFGVLTGEALAHTWHPESFHLRLDPESLARLRRHALGVVVVRRVSAGAALVAADAEAERAPAHDMTRTELARVRLDAASTAFDAALAGEAMGAKLVALS